MLRGGMGWRPLRAPKLNPCLGTAQDKYAFSPFVIRDLVIGLDAGKRDRRLYRLWLCIGLMRI